MLANVPHFKLFLKASHLCILVNSHESGNGSFELMGRHTGVPTGDVVAEGIMDEHVLVLNIIVIANSRVCINIVNY